MAVVAFKSTEEAGYDLVPPTRIGTLDKGKLRFARFSFTAASAGDATSTVELARLEPGQGRILGDLSKIWFSALGASRVLKIGLRAYTKIDGTSNAEDDDVLAASVDVSSAGSAAMTTGAVLSNDKSHKVSSRDTVVVFATVTGGTIPADATFDGYLVYAHD